MKNDMTLVAVAGGESGKPEGFMHRTLRAMMDSLGELQPYLLDPTINEIQVNGPDSIFVRRGGKDTQLHIKVKASQIDAVIRLIATVNQKLVNTTQDEDGKQKFKLSARLPGLRVEAVLPPVAVDGPFLVMRRHAAEVFDLQSYVTRGTATQAQVDLIDQIVKSEDVFLISGSTYSGKTTLMNSVLARVPLHERLVCIEVVQELQLKHANKAMLEVDPDRGATASALLESSMRLSPHRLIVGELKGREAGAFLHACGTGHGGAATLHANNAQEALGRLEDLVMLDSDIPHEAVQANIGTRVKWVIQIRMEGDKRQITEILQVKGFDRNTKSYITQLHQNARGAPTLIPGSDSAFSASCTSAVGLV